MGFIRPWPPDEEQQSTLIKFPTLTKPADARPIPASVRRIEATARRVGDKYLLSCDGQPGLPWRRGHLYIEHDPELQPLLARGLGADVGEYWRLSKMPQVKAALDDFVAACVGSAWRLKRLDLPDWAQSDPVQVAAWERHSALAERVWWHWQHLGQRGLRALISEKAEFAFICGFSLHEICLEKKVMDLGDGPRLYLFPDEIPELRSPWSILYWLTQRERIVGVVQTLSYVSDYDGNAGPFQVVIPWDKCDHYTILQAGPTDVEGQSALRPARRSLQSLQQAYQLQSLAIEVNGVGTAVVKKNDGQAPPLTDAQRAEIAAFLESYRAEHMPWFLAPDGYELDILSPQSTVPDLSPQILTYERAASLALNQSHKLIGLHGHGSFAARASAADSAYEAYTLPVTRLADNLSSLLAKIIKVNYPADDVIYTPDVLWFAAAEDEAQNAYSKALAVKTYTDAGYLTREPTDQASIREELGLPPEPEPEEIVDE